MLLSGIAVVETGAQVLSTPNGALGSNGTSNEVQVNGYTRLVNPTGNRTLIIEKDNDDSWLTFHDPNDNWYSMGIDRSNSGSFALNTGGTLGASNHFVLNSGGHIGLGTATPLHRLDVSGAIAISGVRVLNTQLSADGSDIYINGRVIRNESTVHQDGMYLNYNGAGGGAAHLRFFANGTSERMRIDAATGNVGIGTSAPGSNLEIKGSGNFVETRIIHSSEDPSRGLRFRQNSDMSGRIVMDSRDLWVEAGWDKRLFLGNEQYNTYGGMVIFPGGKVGIGTTTPDEKLTVKGKIHTQEVRVDMTGSVAPDYVFNADYQLPSLETIKAYIDQYHHLPEIPSANDIAKNGIELGEMNLLLLKKIEELTLHMIALKKQNDELSKQVNRIEQKMPGKRIE